MQRCRAAIPCRQAMLALAEALSIHLGWHSLEGKRVLIRCYHGLGDTIQFIRFAPMVKKIAKEVIVWAQPKLIPLLETMDGIDQLLPLHDGTPEVEYDVDVETMELPHIFRTTLDTLPAQFLICSRTITYFTKN